MLEARRFAIKERKKFLAAYATYDLFDADTQTPLAVAEEKVGPLTQLARWFISKALLPTTVEVRAKPDDALLFSLRRGSYIFRSRVLVRDDRGETIGYFKSKVLTLGGGFHVYTKDDTHFAEVKGNWIGFNYRFLTPDREVELGRVSKEWGGIATEVFFSADSYLVELSDELAGDPMARTLILAAALATDMIFKSESRTGGDGLLDNV